MALSGAPYIGNKIGQIFWRLKFNLPLYCCFRIHCGRREAVLADVCYCFVAMFTLASRDNERSHYRESLSYQSMCYQFPFDTPPIPGADRDRTPAATSV